MFMASELSSQEIMHNFCVLAVVLVRIYGFMVSQLVTAKK
jgi:hypothetical protein